MEDGASQILRAPLDGGGPCCTLRYGPWGDVCPKECPEVGASNDERTEDKGHRSCEERPEGRAFKSASVGE